MKQIKRTLFLCLISTVFFVACGDEATIDERQVNTPQTAAWYTANHAQLATMLQQCTGDEATLSEQSKVCTNATTAARDISAVLTAGYAMLEASQKLVSNKALNGLQSADELAIQNDPAQFPILAINPENGKIEVEMIGSASGIKLYAIPTLNGAPIVLGEPITQALEWTCYTNQPAETFILIPQACQQTWVQNE